jgi:tripeptidyl-peptidase I
MSSGRNNWTTENLESMETHIFKESIPHLSSRADLLKGDRVHHAHTHEVVFMIRQRNMDELTRKLEDVSDPSSPNYGQHMTMNEVVAMTANPEGLVAVTSYLVRNGATIVSETLHGEYVTAAAPIAVWEKVLNTEFFTFHQTQVDGRIEALVRAESYSIPRELGAHVMHVMNTIDTPLMTHSSSRTTPSVVNQKEKSRFHTTGDWQAVSPRKIKIFYNMTNYQGSNQSTQAVYESGGQNFSPKDLKQFQSTFNLKQQTAIAINGNNNDTVCVVDRSRCGESNLDLQYIMGVSQGSPSTHWYVPGDFLYWLILVTNTVNPPLVLSISWGSFENLVAPSNHDAFSYQAIKLGVMGITIFVSSGDDGANSGYARGNTAACGYRPSFPATNPYVVSVGATSVSTSHCCVIDIEKMLLGLYSSNYLSSTCFSL